MTQFQPHAWVRHNVADVSCLHAVLCHDPKLIADACVTNWGPTLSGLATDRLKQRISGRRDADCKEKLNRRVSTYFCSA
jgi:hypothetical protein